ncbi:MAG: hypothetical protein L6306_01745 [Planctomycetales bacterium]|nr:hypothetical protein [Planctomycetales bacterium]
MNMFAHHAAARTAFALIVAAGIFGSAALNADEQKPAAPAQQEADSAQRIDELIRQLGDEDYYVRKRAQEELGRLGFEAFDALDAAADHEDLEIASRARYLLRLMRIEWTTANDPPEVKQCLQDYETQNASAREMRMRVLARLPDGRGIPALCRLVRFEKSSALSKSASVAFLARAKAAPPQPAAIETIRKGLKKCNRTGAGWMLAWTRLGEGSESEMAEWSKFIDDEHNALKRTPKESSPEIVSGLVRFQVDWLNKLGKADEAAEAVRRLVALERGNPQSLAELLDWLIEQKAWRAVDDLARRFPPRFAVDPPLLYALAQAYSEQGKNDQAEQTAARAFRLHPGKQREQLLNHLRTAEILRDRGQYAWARREYEHVIEQSGRQQIELMAIARIYLAEMLHDQGENLDAANTLEKMFRAIDAGKADAAKLYGGNVNELRSRTHYFFACHWEAKRDAAKQREALDKALAVNPEDIDVLIACHRLPGQPPEYRAKIAGLIEKAAEEFRDAIAENPENAAAFNQYAWLIGNTAGDLDEALKCSLKSLELEPETGGYHDTLAHVYFAKGDYENAVKSQTKAVELEPHSGIIGRKLELFREKLKEKKGR